MAKNIKIWGHLSIEKPKFNLGTPLGKGFVYGCSREGFIDSMYIKVAPDNSSAWIMYGTNLDRDRFYTEKEIEEILANH